MRLGFKYLAVLIGISVLSGCASMQSTNVESAQKAVASEAPKPELPELELTAEILNKSLLADIAIQRAQYGVAVKLYRDLAVETRDPRLAERATRVALFSRSIEIARETGEIWITLDPANIDARQIMTALYVKNGEFNAALALLEGLLEESSDDDHERYMLILRLLGREQDKEGARTLVEKYLERYPDDVAGLYAYAQLALRDGKVEDSDKASVHLLEIKPDWSAAVVLRTRILQATNRGDEALAYLQDVVKRKPKDGELRAELGRMLLDAGEYEEAQTHFERILRSEPDKVDILFLAGGVALQLQKLDQAEKHFLHLYEIGERQDESAFFIGNIEEQREKYEEAIDWYGKVRRGANYIDAHARIALLQARMGDVDTARAHLSTVNARGEGQRLKLLLVEGEILREVDRNEEALEFYDQALVIMPGRSELLYARAMVADKLGRLDVFEQDLLAVLEKEPDHVEALNSLGYVLADRTERYGEALTYIKRALELRPDAFHIMDSYAWVQYRLGNLDEALTYLRRAIAINFDPEIAAHLGEVLWVKGDREEARNVWQEALERSPGSKFIKDAMDRFEK